MRTIILVSMLILLSFTVVSDTTINPLTKGYADTLYCAIADGCSSTDENVMYLYLNTSRKSTIHWNLSDSDASIINFPVYPGEEYIFGGTI